MVFRKTVVDVFLKTSLTRTRPTILTILSFQTRCQILGVAIPLSMSVTICNFMRSVKNYRGSRRANKKIKRSPIDGGRETPTAFSENPLGWFNLIPEEMRFQTFRFLRPSDLGSISMASKAMRDTVMKFLHGKESLEVIIPFVPKPKETSTSLPNVVVPRESAKCFEHFHNLGKTAEI